MDEVQIFKGRFLSTQNEDGIKELFKNKIWQKYPDLLVDKDILEHYGKYCKKYDDSNYVNEQIDSEVLRNLKKKEE